MNRQFLLSFLVFGAAALFGARCQAASVEVGEMTIPTYMFSDPDPVPSPQADYYPYFRFDGYEAKSSPRSWKTVVLENDRIVVTITPEVGGKIWGAVDKKTGVDFIYFNHVAKFRDVAMRGPWSSGGIEFNFGKMGHEPYVSTPVDWSVSTNVDGSVSCFVGGFEWLCRTYWQVEVRLKDGNDFFTTHATWFNGSGLPQTYYQWMNAAFHGGGDTRYFYPGSNWIGHGGDVHPWPIEDGHDISVYSQNDIAGEKEDHRAMHIVNGDSRYLGAWWPHLGAGALHINRMDMKYGRKIWMWGLSRQGAIWEGLLTDSDGPYVELQSGRCFIQPQGKHYMSPFKFSPFVPGSTDSFDETWAVIREESAFTKLDVKKNIKPRPVEMSSDFDWQSAYGHFIHGQQIMRGTRGCRPEDAEKSFRASLAKDPCFANALNALATLLISEARSDEALPLVNKALAIDTFDFEANYLDGILHWDMGDLATARERFGLASYSPALRSAALAASARISLAEGAWDEAIGLAKDALKVNDANIDAIVVIIAANRLSGNVAAAKKFAEEAYKKMPVNSILARELELCGGRSFTAKMECELSERVIVEVGNWYELSGLYKDAAKVYAYAPKSIIAVTRAAFLAHKAGDKAQAKALLNAAMALPVGFDFAFRRESVPAFAWASKETGCWKFRFQEALFCASHGRNGRADQLLEECGNAIDEVGALIMRSTRRKGEQALADVRRAKEIDDSWRVGLAFYAAYIASDDWASARRVLEDYAKRFPGRLGIELNYARSLVKTGSYAEAVSFLEGIDTLPSELGEKPMSIYHEALGALADEALMKGDSKEAMKWILKAIKYPETLGTGRPYKLDNLFNSWPKRVKEFCIKERVGEKN